MMTCQKVIDDFLMAYVAGELSWSERLRFRFHILICRECMAYVKSYKDTIELGKAAFEDADAPVGPEVPEKLVRAIIRARKDDG